ncbi:12587_t:CDS:2 [Funneliformis geosporum]|uniref:14206_t:CDS:1 n=1 Tax=Funneliformis geosporum TaxID=1117311 RepID=A0A9W4SA45_9GLOM|nr:14206_t:CDS:2 [Funneliformis geosporum]CAI2166294.1 12587_t:CDS:2 [Funneliformis geosporum]
MSTSCIFCKIIERKIPSVKIFETALSYAFLDVGPLSEGHTLVIPKYHAKFLHELPDEYLADILPVAKKVAIATGAEQYNLLQNNGPLAHQVVEHVHFHVIPKPNDVEGLGIKWPSTKPSKEEIDATAKRMLEKL